MEHELFYLCAVWSVTAASVDDNTNDKISFYFYPTDSLIQSLKEQERIIPRIIQEDTTIIRTNKGRRSDLGSVGPRCFSWAGSELHRENWEEENMMTHLVGRKGGMV